MTLFFPDVNVWIALSVSGHQHHDAAWEWLRGSPSDATVCFSRFTQLGLLRLLTNNAIMGDTTLTLGEAWGVFDRWLEDPRVELYHEPRNVDAAYRDASKPFAARAATKCVGDCWLVAFAQTTQAKLVTFDRALGTFARKRGCGAVVPA
jgi:toxin-antitoxin system PIN domain toxin